MRTTNNNFTVEALVAKYRNFVIEHCPKSCEFDGVKEFLMPISPDANADEQLLVTLYHAVAKNDADKQVLFALAKYGEKYQHTAFDKEEFSFLCEHFKELVSYEFAHRSDWIGGFIVGGSVPSQIMDIIREMATPKKGQTVFVADAGLCDVAVLFPDCVLKGFTGYCGSTLYDEVWALGQIRLYAAGIESEIVSGYYDENKEKYMYTLSEENCADIVIYGTTWASECDDVHQLYHLLKENGTMFLFSDRKAMADDGILRSLREQLVSDRAIQLLGSFEGDFIGMATDVILAYISKKNNDTVEIVNGKRETTKVVKAEELDSDILWPSYYMAKKPSEGIPLSSVVRLSRGEKLAKFVKGKGHVLPKECEDMLLVLHDVLGERYQDADLGKKDLVYVNDPVFLENNKWKWFRVVKEPCVLIHGSTEKLRVGYTNVVPEKGLAYLPGCCLTPKDGIDIRYIAALLLSSSVKEQILTICDGDVNERTLSLVLDKIIVPSHDEKERLSFLVKASHEALTSLKDEWKTGTEQYKKSVRMRKHALTQSLSSVESMFYALNAYRLRQKGKFSDDGVISRVKGTTVKDAFEFLAKNIESMMPTLEHIADVEYSFGKQEWIDPEKFIEEYIMKNEKGWLNFKSVITWEQGHNQAMEDLKDPSTGDIILRKGDSLNMFLFPKDALERVFKNIISNAKAHGFVDKSRNDYKLRFSWHVDGMALIVEIDNNGSAIPNDRDTASLLEYGVSTNLHNDGHNGIGCNEIDDIMQKYDGKVEIISSPENDFPVKYILTFNRSNTVRSFKI